MSKVEKKNLYSQIKKHNVSEKKMDNLMIITGSKNPVKFDDVIPQISALTTKQSQGHGAGYMFSQNLVNALVSPQS